MLYEACDIVDKSMGCEIIFSYDAFSAGYLYNGLHKGLKLLLLCIIRASKILFGLYFTPRPFRADPPDFAYVFTYASATGEDGLAAWFRLAGDDSLWAGFVLKSR